MSSSFIIINSAEPGTKIGTLYCFSFSGFSRFISIKPIQHRWSIIFCVSSSVMLFFFARTSGLYPTRVFLNDNMNFTSSFVSSSSNIQYSGSSVFTECVNFALMRLVIMHARSNNSFSFSGSAAT